MSRRSKPKKQFVALDPVRHKSEGWEGIVHHSYPDAEWIPIRWLDGPYSTNLPMVTSINDIEPIITAPGEPATEDGVQEDAPQASSS